MHYLSDKTELDIENLKKDDILHLLCRNDESIPVSLFQKSIENGFNIIPHILNSETDIELGFEVGKIVVEINDDIIILPMVTNLANLVGKKVGEYKIKSLNDSKKTVMKRGPKDPRKPKNELKPESKSQNTIEKPETEEKFLPESTKDSSGIKVPSKAVSLLKENNVKEDDMLKICKAASKTQGGVVGFEIQLQMMFGKERGIILFNKLRNIFDKLKKIVGDDF